MPPEEVVADRDGDVPVRSVVEVAALAVLAVEKRSVEPRRHAVNPSALVLTERAGEPVVDRLPGGLVTGRPS